MKWFNKIVEMVKSIFGTQKPEIATTEQIPAPVSQEPSTPEIDEDIDIMARTLWGEARSEDVQGMQAVACVIMNRYRENIWYSKHNGEHSIKAVCLKPMQFSCWNDNDPNAEMCAKVDTKDRRFVQALEIAAAAKAGKLEDFTNGANHYFADYIPKPKWAEGMQFCITIGRHNFYRG